MTLQEIINYADRKYPNVETVANKVIDLNKLQSELFMKLDRLSNTYTINVATVTVADQIEYTFPENVRLEDIIKIEAETAEDSEIYDEFFFIGVKDAPSYSKVFMRGSDNTKYYLYDNKLPLTSADRIIRIHHFPRPALLSSDTLSAIPSLDAEYHSLLAYGLIVEIASQGHNPDTEIADYYQRKYDEFYRDVTHSLSGRAISGGTQRKQQKERW